MSVIRAVSLAQRLANILVARGKAASFFRDCCIQDDSDGLPPWLASWNETTLGLTPTQAEVDAASTAPTVEAARRLAIHDDPLRVDLLTRLQTASAAQISNYVDANVIDIASARALFKRILLLIALDARNGG